LDPLCQKFVSCVGVCLVQNQTGAAGACQGEVRPLTLQRGVGEADLTTQTCTGDLGCLIARAQLKLLPVFSDHLLLLLYVVVQNEKLGSETKMAYRARCSTAGRAPAGLGPSRMCWCASCYACAGLFSSQKH
ncbi:hypothetical protein EGW08_017413, partial [Elysia chlorotica]